MFVRKKKNPSGVVSVQVIDKSHGQYTVMKTIGSSADQTVVEQLVRQGHQWIARQSGQLPLDLNDEVSQTEAFLKSIDQITVAGTHRLLGEIYDEIGFYQIPDSLFRTLVISRVCFPPANAKRPSI